MMRDLCRVTSGGRRRREWEMPWAVRGGTLAKKAKRAVFQRKHTAQIGSTGSSLFCLWLRTPSHESYYPELLGQPAGCFTFCLWQANPRCVTDGGGEAKSGALVSRLLENKSYLLLLSGQP